MHQNENSPIGNGDHFMSVKEIAAWLGVSKFTIYSWVSARMVPHYKVQKRVLFLRAELDEWVKSHRIVAS